MSNSENKYEVQAREANSAENWDKLWTAEGLESWRGAALSDVYDRISALTPPKSKIIDVGGGVGLLAKKLETERECTAEVWDISSAAVETARSQGLKAEVCDLETSELRFESDSVVVCTECLEHLSETTRDRLLKAISRNKKGQAFISVPNDRLGPDEEPQHTVKFTALEYKIYLEQYFEDVRVEVLGPVAPPIAGYPSNRGQPSVLLAVCGFPKKVKMSVCFPARDEAADIEKTLASFRGVADEMIVGIDPRTQDNTWEIAAKYAEKVFFLTSPQGSVDETGKKMDEKGVHFAWIRNQCLDRCEGPWIFMTEAHEPLTSGQDALLHLEHLPEACKVVSVIRRGGPAAKRQRWAFPWLIKKDPKIRYIRSTHNTVDFPEGTLVIGMPQVQTLHERVHERDLARREQRKIQNRRDLMDDWLTNQNENSLFYLGSEWREFDDELKKKGVASDRAMKYLKEYIVINRSNGPLRYHTRLIVAKMLWQRGELEEAKELLHAASRDDWSRIEHWLFLGDICVTQKRPDEALQYYLYASTRIKTPPFTVWWIDEAFYSYLPAQRLATVYAELGQLDKALHWAEQVTELLPEESPKEAFEEAEDVVKQIAEAIHG